MILKKGKSNETIGKNVEKLVHEWEQDATIGKSHPPSKKKAIKQAVAISLKQAGKSRAQQKDVKK